MVKRYENLMMAYVPISDGITPPKNKISEPIWIYEEKDEKEDRIRASTKQAQES